MSFLYHLFLRSLNSGPQAAYGFIVSVTLFMGWAERPGPPSFVEVSTKTCIRNETGEGLNNAVPALRWHVFGLGLLKCFTVSLTTS